MITWRLRVAASAERSPQGLTEQVTVAVVEFMVGPLLEALQRVGKPLQRELEGVCSARRGACRVIYALDQEQDVVDVLRIEHRADAYRPR